MSSVSASSSVWFKRFMIFLLVIIVALCFGLTIFYFLRDNETLLLNKNLESLNIGDEFTLSVIHQNKEGGTSWELNYDNSALEMISENDNKDGGKDYVFKAVAESAVSTQVTLLSNRDKFNGQYCTVTIADGTKENPFVIRNAAELASIGKSESRPLSAHYKQINNIDLKDYENWTPIGTTEGNAFTGSYNGDYNYIYNLTINNTSNQVVAGLFGYVATGAQVSNLNIDTVNITAPANMMGTVAGQNKGTIERINVTNAVLTNNSTFVTSPSYEIGVGGIVGITTRDTININISRVSFNGNIEVATSNVTTNVGGIAGANFGSTIRNAYARGSIVSSNTNNNVVIGGLVGLNAATTEVQTEIKDYTTNLKGNIINCYTTVAIDADNTTKKGYIVGRNVNPDGTEPTTFVDTDDENVNRIIGVYALNNNAGLGWCSTAQSVAQGYFINVLSADDLTQGLTTTAYRTYNTESGNNKVKVEATWNFEQVWGYSADVNDGYPTLILNGASVEELSIYDPYSDYISNEISTAADLNNIRNRLDGTYTLVSDIDLSGYDWEPIGTQENPFVGSLLNPDGYIISGLNITNHYNYAGLFGYNSGVINGLIVEGANISDGFIVGIIAGYNNGEIQGCRVTGSISAGTYVGTVTGINNRLVENTNAATSTITLQSSSYKEVGGIAGVNYATLNNVESRTVISISATAGNVNVGGIVGSNAETNAIVSNATRYDNTSISVTGTLSHANVGGIAGLNLYRIENSKASSTISIDTAIAEGYAGGIVGYNMGNNATVELCETVSGSVKANWTGGVVGYSTTTDNNVVSVTRSMVQSNVTLLGNEIGGLAGKIDRGKITNSATFAKLDGKKMSGFASVISGSTDSSGNGNYATVEYCFSAVTYTPSSGSMYCETSSEIRASNLSILFNENKGKVAGYVKSSIYDSNLAGNAERKYSSYRLGNWQLVQPDDGRTSTDDCKKASTFTNRGFSTEFWSLIDGQYPTIKGL